MTKTKRVRIAVAVDCNGLWGAAPLCGDGEAPRQALIDFCGLEHLEHGEQISVIEADVPMPEEPATVRGDVVNND